MLNQNLINNRQTAYIFLAAVFLLSIDRFLKTLAINLWVHQPQMFFNNYFGLIFKKNTGIAFSLNFNPNIILIFSIIFILILAFYLIKVLKNSPSIVMFGLTFIIFGAISNLIDRLNYGYVIDYFYLKGLTIFNLADFIITLGAIFLMIYFFRSKNDINRKKTSKPTTKII